MISPRASYRGTTIICIGNTTSDGAITYLDKHLHLFLLDHIAGRTVCVDEVLPELPLEFGHDHGSITRLEKLKSARKRCVTNLGVRPTAQRGQFVATHESLDKRHPRAAVRSDTQMGKFQRTFGFWSSCLLPGPVWWACRQARLRTQSVNNQGDA